MERLKLTCKGPAWIIVPLSESVVDRWLFNDIVDKVVGKDVKDEETLMKVNEVTGEFFECLSQFPELGKTPLPAPVEENREEYRKFHNQVLETLEERG